MALYLQSRVPVSVGRPRFTGLTGLGAQRARGVPRQFVLCSSANEGPWTSMDGNTWRGPHPYAFSNTPLVTAVGNTVFCANGTSHVMISMPDMRAGFSGSMEATMDALVMLDRSTFVTIDSSGIPINVYTTNADANGGWKVTHVPPAPAAGVINRFCGYYKGRAVWMDSLNNIGFWAGGVAMSILGRSNVTLSRGHPRGYGWAFFDGKAINPNPSSQIDVIEWGGNFRQIAQIGTAGSVQNVAAGNGCVIVVGSGGIVLRSTDCINWSNVTMPIAMTSVVFVLFNGERFVLCDMPGGPNIYFSDDGISWQKSPTVFAAAAFCGGTLSDVIFSRGAS